MTTKFLKHTGYNSKIEPIGKSVTKKNEKTKNQNLKKHSFKNHLEDKLDHQICSRNSQNSVKSILRSWLVSMELNASSIWR